MVETLVVGSELQVNNYSGWLQMESSSGLCMVAFKWITVVVFH